METTFAVAVTKIAELPLEEQRAIAIDFLTRAAEKELPTIV